jgi:serine/threonine protein phosphatase PrpC
MEDRSTWFSLYDRYDCGAVADGHGGTSFFAIYVTKMIRFYLQSYLRSRPLDIQSVLKRMVSRLQIRLKQFKTLYQDGGTTLTVCIIDRERSVAFFANLGDSPGFVFSNAGSSGYYIKFRTDDHVESNPLERSRIAEQIAGTKYMSQVFYSKGYLHTSRYTKIMPLRGFGDFKFDAVIGREPQLYDVRLQDGDIVLLASDGLLERLVGGNLMSGRDETEICEDIDRALEENKNLAHALIESKITRIANAYMADRRKPMDEQHFNSACQTVENAMDNHIILLHRFQAIDDHVDEPQSVREKCKINSEPELAPLRRCYSY